MWRFNCKLQQPDEGLFFSYTLEVSVFHVFSADNSCCIGPVHVRKLSFLTKGQMSREIHLSRYIGCDYFTGTGMLFGANLHKQTCA